MEEQKYPVADQLTTKLNTAITIHRQNLVSMSHSFNVTVQSASCTASCSVSYIYIALV